MITQLLTLAGSYSPKQLVEPVPHESEQMSRTWSALDVTALGLFPREQAFQVYGVIKEDLEVYEEQWHSLRRAG